VSLLFGIIPTSKKSAEQELKSLIPLSRKQLKAYAGNLIPRTLGTLGGVVAGPIGAAAGVAAGGAIEHAFLPRSFRGKLSFKQQVEEPALRALAGPFAHVIGQETSIAARAAGVGPTGARIGGQLGESFAAHFLGGIE
jgi:hypothetical protein